MPSPPSVSSSALPWASTNPMPLTYSANRWLRSPENASVHVPSARVPVEAYCPIIHSYASSATSSEVMGHQHMAPVVASLIALPASSQKTAPIDSR